MAFDLNEARQIIEDAKKRGLISDANSPARPSAPAKPAATKAQPKAAASSAVIPDWLQKGITDAASGVPPVSNDHLFSRGD